MSAAAHSAENGVADSVLQRSAKASKNAYEARVYNNITVYNKFVQPASDSLRGAPLSEERFFALLDDEANRDGLFLVTKYLPLVEYSALSLGLRVAVEQADLGQRLGFVLAKHGVTVKALCSYALGRDTVPPKLIEIKRALADVGLTVERAKLLLRRLDSPGLINEDNDRLLAILYNDFAVEGDLSHLDGHGICVPTARTVTKKKNSSSSSSSAAAASAAASPSGAASSADNGVAVNQSSKPKKNKKRSAVEAAQTDEDGGATAAASSSDAKTPRHPTLNPQLIKTLVPFKDGLRQCAVRGCKMAQQEGAGKANKGKLQTDMAQFDKYGVPRMVCKEHLKTAHGEHGTVCVRCNVPLYGDDGMPLPAINPFLDPSLTCYLHTDISTKTLHPKQKAPLPIVMCPQCLTEPPGMAELFAFNGLRIIVDNEDNISMDTMKEADIALAISGGKKSAAAATLATAKKNSAAMAATSSAPVVAAAAAAADESMDEDEAPVATIATQSNPPKEVVAAVDSLKATAAAAAAKPKPVVAPTTPVKTAAAASTAATTTPKKPTAAAAIATTPKKPAAPADLMAMAFEGKDDTATVPSPAQSVQLAAATVAPATSCVDPDLDALLDM